MNRVAVVDSGLSNLDSVVRGLERQGATVTVVRESGEMGNPSHVVIPGVGAFPEAMRNLEKGGLVDAIREQALERERPLLGICLGMQLLASRGGEVEESQGLGLIEGEVVKMEPVAEAERVPHVGWNEVIPRGDAKLFAGLEAGTDFYFVHGFHLVPADDSTVAATTDHCGGFVSAVQRGHIFGVQFHPEKSMRSGTRVLQNFLSV